MAIKITNLDSETLVWLYNDSMVENIFPYMGSLFRVIKTS